MAVWDLQSRLSGGGERNDGYERHGGPLHGAMGSMMGGGMMGSNLLLDVLTALLVIWLVGLAAVGVLGFRAVRRLSRPHTW